MIISQIQATLPYNIKTVWTAVTDIKNYHWRRIFLEQGTSTLVHFTEEITVKKFYLKPILKFYLRRQQKLFIKDLQAYLQKKESKCKS